MPLLALVSRKGPILLHDYSWPYVEQPVLQKLNEFSYEVLRPLSYLSDLLPISSSSNSTTFCRENASTTSRRKNAFQEFVESQSINFYATGINKLISHWQNVFIVMVHILVNKDVFESSYNDLKCIVPNCNYICTNLIK